VTPRPRPLLVAIEAFLALGILLNLGACSRGEHPTDMLASPGRSAGSFAGGVNLPVPANLVLSPTTVAGGATSTGTVQLDNPALTGGQVVTLSSSSAAATVPASVTIAAGGSSATFTVTTTAVAATTSATINATANGKSRPATLTITAGGVVAGVSLATIALAPTSVAARGTSVGTVTLSGAAPAAGAVVTLRSANTAVATVPASVTVAAGATSATFTVTAGAPTVTSTVGISGTFGGVTRTATLTVTAAAPVAALSAVSLTPASVNAGTSSTGTVTLTSAAPAAGFLVSLSSSAPASAAVPASVTVAGGATTATFTVTTPPAVVGSSAIVTATANLVSRTATLTITPTDPCANIGGLGGNVVLTAASVPQFRTGRLRVDLVGDVPLGWINAIGTCTSVAPPAVSFISGTCNVTLAGTSTSVIPGGPLTFTPLLIPVPAEPGVVLATDAAGNVLQIIWPALAGLPPGPPTLRTNLVAWTAAVQSGVLLDATLTYTAQTANGATATFTARGTNMPVPTFRP